jgi:ATP-binding cassette subfamily B (MDR/TAP) protein 1
MEEIKSATGTTAAVKDTKSAKETVNDKVKQAKPKAASTASVSDTLSFIFMCGPKTTAFWFLGMLGGVGNGAVYPVLAYLFSNSFSDIANASNNGLEQVRELAYYFLAVGVFAFIMATVQTTCFEVVAFRASQKLRLQWFHSLLRQDPAFFDVHDIGGLASNVGPASNRFRRGLGRKFGEGIQFLTTGIGGIGFALWVSWRVALVVLAITPFVALSALMVVSLNQTKSARAAKSYGRAGSLAYSSVSAIRTVLSLNAVPQMIRQYSEATQDAFNNATSILLKQGFANGMSDYEALSVFLEVLADRCFCHCRKYVGFLHLLVRHPGSLRYRVALQRRGRYWM